MDKSSGFIGSRTISTGDHGDQNRDYEPNHELFITLTECFLQYLFWKWGCHPKQQHAASFTCRCDVTQLLPRKEGVHRLAQRFYCTFSSWRSHIFLFLVVWFAAQEWKLVSHGKNAGCTGRCAHNLLIWTWTLSRLLQDTSFSRLGCRSGLRWKNSFETLFIIRNFRWCYKVIRADNYSLHT